MSQRGELEGSLPDRILEQMEHLRNDYGGFPVDRLEHSVQTATRAERDGRDDEYVLLMHLLHDLGDPLAPFNHPEIAAAIVKPFVSKQTIGWLNTMGFSRATTSGITLVWIVILVIVSVTISITTGVKIFVRNMTALRLIRSINLIRLSIVSL